MVLSLFQDSEKEGALTYTDWCREVKEYLRKGYDDNRVKDTMLSSVEGQAYVNFRSCDEGRNCTPAQILKEMDIIYNISIMFRDLNAWMCGLKQGMNEPIKSYYEWMADISIKLEQYHGDLFGPGELSLMKKDCFYAGLKEHNKYLVSHMKDHDQYGPVQMLKEIREQEDSHYPLNTMPKPHSQDNYNKILVITVEKAHHMIRPKHTLLGTPMYSSQTWSIMSLTHPQSPSSMQARYTMRGTMWP